MNSLQTGEMQPQVETESVFPGHKGKAAFFKEDFIYLFLERRGGNKKERERNINVWLLLACPQLGSCPAVQACALTGNRTSVPFVRRPALNPLSQTRAKANFYREISCPGF